MIQMEARLKKRCSREISIYYRTWAPPDSLVIAQDSNADRREFDCFHLYRYPISLSLQLKHVLQGHPCHKQKKPLVKQAGEKAYFSNIKKSLEMEKRLEEIHKNKQLLLITPGSA